MQFSSIAIRRTQLKVVLLFGCEPETCHLSKLALAICIPLTLHRVMLHHLP